jgi:hypothetical protein
MKKILIAALFIGLTSCTLSKPFVDANTSMQGELVAAQRVKGHHYMLTFKPILPARSGYISLLYGTKTLRPRFGYKDKYTIYFDINEAKRDTLTRAIIKKNK